MNFFFVKPGAMPGFSFIDHAHPDVTPIVHGQKVQQAQPGVERAAYSAKRAVNYIPESHCWCVAFQGPLPYIELTPDISVPAYKDKIESEYLRLNNTIRLVISSLVAQNPSFLCGLVHKTTRASAS